MKRWSWETGGSDTERDEVWNRASLVVGLKDELSDIHIDW
uniref:Uncharacterized protein n=1 Tax=Rhizophora mucronata TaxID=61149 RepID=A0A2P2Q3H9_RHIMU